VEAHSGLDRGYGRKALAHDIGCRLADCDLGPLTPTPQIISEFQKFLLTARQNHFYIRRRPHLTEGRLEIVMDARRDAVDVDALLTNGAEADGESVWS